MLRSSLKTLVPNPEELLEAAGLSPELRAERLTVRDFAKLALCLRAPRPRADKVAARDQLQSFELRAMSEDVRPGMRGRDPYARGAGQGSSARSRKHSSNSG